MCHVSHVLAICKPLSQSSSNILTTNYQHKEAIDITYQDINRSHFSVHKFSLSRVLKL